MAQTSRNLTTKLESIKNNVKQSYDYFKKNYKRYHEFRRFLYLTTLTDNDITNATELQLPQEEFNLVEAYVSRLCGEFSKMDPAFTVRAIEAVKLVNPEVIEVVEGHMKAAFKGADKDSLAYRLYKHTISGGFSVAKVYTDYSSPMSFDQKICVDMVFDPTLCGFDPLARKSHKGDGRYAYELFPKCADEAKAIYGSDILKGVSFTRDPNFSSFNWSYRNQHEDIMMFCEYFEIVKKKEKIVKLANGHVLPLKSYEKFLNLYKEIGGVEQPPIIIKQRETEIESIELVTLTQGKIIDRQKTDYSMLPLVFFDGNSEVLRENDQSPAQQVTRPYIYNAKGAQRLKNYSGQSLINEIENIPQHRWMASVEGIPDNDDYQLAYTQPQKASILLYNAFLDNDTSKLLPAPQAVPRVPIPREIPETFGMADNLIQSILGSYDAAIGVNENDISGIAIMQGAMHSNAAAMPYTVGFIDGWNRCGEIYLNLLPKYYVTPRSIPIIKKDGKREFYEINKPGNVFFDYDTTALEVTVEAGVNFAVQKQIALKTIIALMQASPLFAQFMNEDGLEVLLDNIDIKGIDRLKVMATQFMKKTKAAQQQAQEQAANQPSPLELAVKELQIEEDKIAQKREEAQIKSHTNLAMNAADNAEKSKEADIKFLEVMAKVQNQEVENALQQEKVDAENARSTLMAVMEVDKHIQEKGKSNQNEITERDSSMDSPELEGEKKPRKKNKKST
jgi:hypothetical protein